MKTARYPATVTARSVENNDVDRLWLAVDKAMAAQDFSVEYDGGAYVPGARILVVNYQVLSAIEVDRAVRTLEGQFPGVQFDWTMQD